MTDSEPDKKIKQHIKQILDSEKLDQETLQKLKKARIQALEPSPAAFRFSRYSKPIAAFVSVCFIVIAMTLSFNSSNQSTSMSDIETLEIITSNEPLELYENLEFYLWMDEEANTRT